MRFKLATLFIFVLSCSDDELSRDCLLSDRLGIYEGTIDCDGNSETVTVNISVSGGDNLIINYVLNNGSVTTNSLSPNGCNIEVALMNGGSSFVTKASLNEDALIFSETFNPVNGNSSSCLIMATRQ